MTGDRYESFLGRKGATKNREHCKGVRGIFVTMEEKEPEEQIEKKTLRKLRGKSWLGLGYHWLTL